MKEKENDLNINISRSEPLTTNNTSSDNNLPNPQIIEINRHQDLMAVLRQIAENTRRNGRAGDSVGLYTVFLVGLFFIYMGICLYRDGGFNTIVGPKLFFMIITLFLVIIILHREEQINTIKNIRNKVNEN